MFPKSDAAEPSAMTLTGFAVVADPPAWDAGREGTERNPQPVCSYLDLVSIYKESSLALLVFLRCILLEH